MFATKIKKTAAIGASAAFAMVALAAGPASLVANGSWFI